MVTYRSPSIVSYINVMCIWYACTSTCMYLCNLYETPMLRRQHLTALPFSFLPAFLHPTFALSFSLSLSISILLSLFLTPSISLCFTVGHFAINQRRRRRDILRISKGRTRLWSSPMAHRLPVRLQCPSRSPVARSIHPLAASTFPRRTRRNSHLQLSLLFRQG